MKPESRINHEKPRRSKARRSVNVRTLERVQKQIILDYINVEGHGVLLNNRRLQQLADTLGMSVVELKRLLNALARRGQIQLDSWAGTPVALPYWYRKSAA